VNIQFKVIYWR